MKKNVTYFFAGLLLVFYPFCVFASAINPAFNPNQIIPDSIFPDTKTFSGSSDIQEFLKRKGSVLANESMEFVLKLHEPDDAFLKEKLGDPHYNLGQPRTAARLIWDAAQSSGLNPQVILVTLNKEQGLITGNIAQDDLQRALNHAMGFACPDEGKCEDVFSGFYFQLFGNFDSNDDRYIGAPKSLMKSFNTPNGRGPYVDGRVSHVGDTVTFDNTLGEFDGVQPQQTVVISNLATAALYRYTPHVFNGNYNFWRFFTSWFHYVDGTLIKDVATGALYILKNGARSPVPSFVARLRKLSLGKAVTVSPTELANYSLGPLYGPPNNTVIAVDGVTYLFIKNVKYPASSVVLKQKNLSRRKVTSVLAADATLFSSGAVIMPRDSTVLRAKGKSTVYLVKNGVLKQFSKLTLNQYKARKNVQIISEADLKMYPVSGYVAPLDGTLVRKKGDMTVYLIKKGQKRPMTRELFANLGYKRAQVKILSDAELADILTGPYMLPHQNTYFRVKETKELYLFRDGKIHSISAAVAKKRHIKTNYVFEAEVVKDWPVGKAIAK